MADKKVNAVTGEVQEQEEKKFQYFDRTREEFDPDYQEDGCFAGIRVHCKPVYNYQSIEFDWVIPVNPYECDQESMNAMEAFYTKMLEMLVRVSQNAPQVESKKPGQPQEELASEKQKEILRNFHIDFKEPLTKKQAHALIKKSMDQEIF